MSSKTAIIIIAILHVVGLIGMHHTGIHAWLQAYTPIAAFAALTPFHLLAISGILLYFHTKWHMQFWAFLLGSYLLGFGIEVAGVHTGVIFGNYWYGANLGFKLWEVPLIIGVNWMVLAYCAGTVMQHFALPKPILALFAAILMVITDIFIEPVAMYVDFWQWQNNIVPLQNYVSWGLVAYAMLLLFLYTAPSKKNPVAPALLIAQMLFFAFNNLAIAILK
jgi:putative membrane protein